MKKIRRLVSVIVVSAVAVFTASAKTEGSQHLFHKYEKELNLQTVYSVDMSIDAMGMTMTSKVYKDGDNARSESVIPILNIKTVTLETLKDGEVITHILFPASKKYVVQKQEEGASAGAADDITITDMGTEVFNGEKCNKKRVVIKGDESATMDILFSPKQKNMPVKMTVNANDGEEGIVVVMTFTDYIFKKPDAALFTIPADYTEAKTMEEAMAGSGGLFGMLSAMAAAENQETEEEKAAKKKAEEEAKREAIEAAKKEAADAAKDAAKDEAKGAIRRGIRGLF